MIDIDFSMFFDRPGVDKAVDAGTKKTLSKAGAFVRTRARTSIRKRKQSGTPGSQPSSHTGDLKNRIFFAYDPDTKSVVIGPQLFGSRSARTIELGGYEKGPDGKQVKYNAFPFMGPAMEAETPHFPDLFANSVKG